MRTAHWIATALVFAPAVAGAVDYQALALELRQLKADEDVQIYLQAYPRTAARLEEAERSGVEALREVQASRARLEQHGRSNAYADLAALTGDEVLGKFGREIRTDRRADAAEERRTRS